MQGSTIYNALLLRLTLFRILLSIKRYYYYINNNTNYIARNSERKDIYNVYRHNIEDYFITTTYAVRYFFVFEGNYRSSRETKRKRKQRSIDIDFACTTHCQLLFSFYNFFFCIRSSVTYRFLRL